MFELSVGCNDPGIKYQWQKKNEDSIENRPDYEGVNTFKLIVRSAREEHAGDYCCVVENLAGSSTSQYIQVNVKKGKYL